MTNAERYRKQLDLMCRQPMQAPLKPLSALDRMEAEEEEAKATWEELRSRTRGDSKWHLP